MHRVVIIGGGFGGLYAAQHLRKARDVEVTLIDRRNFHLFQPLLYQVATGGLSPANVASPLRKILGKQKNARVMMGEVVGFEVQAQEVVLKDGERVGYDSLIVATGSQDFYFGHDEWQSLAPPLKEIEDALEIRRRVLSAFEAAERDASCHEGTCPWMRFVFVGAGPTGVELAGAWAEIARDTLQHDFRNIDPKQAQFILLDAGPRVLPAYPEDLSKSATKQLEALGVTVKTNCLVTDIQQDRVRFKQGDDEFTLHANTVVWAAGVKGSPLGKTLAEACGADRSRRGLVVVNDDCSVPNHPNVFVIGDLGHFQHGTDQPLPGVAQVAMQQGKYVAKLIGQRLAGKEVKAFKYFDLGKMAVIGRAAAVADLGRIKFSGFTAWLAWLFIHLINLVEFENRALVSLQWAYAYLSFNRSARLITGGPWPQHPAMHAPLSEPVAATAAGRVQDEQQAAVAETSTAPSNASAGHGHSEGNSHSKGNGHGAVDQRPQEAQAESR